MNHIFGTKILPASKHSWHHVEFILQSASYCCHFLTAEAFWLWRNNDRFVLISKSKRSFCSTQVVRNQQKCSVNVSPEGEWIFVLFFFQFLIPLVPSVAVLMVLRSQISWCSREWRVEAASSKKGLSCDQCAYQEALRNTNSAICCARGSSEFEKIG